LKFKISKQLNLVIFSRSCRTSSLLGPPEEGCRRFGQSFDYEQYYGAVAFVFVPELYRIHGVFYYNRKAATEVYLMKMIPDTILIPYQALLCCTAAAASRLLMLYWHCDLVPCDRSSQYPSSSTPRVTRLCMLTNPLIRKQLGAICNCSTSRDLNIFSRGGYILWARTRDPSLVMTVYGGCDESTIIGEALPTKRSARCGQGVKMATTTGCIQSQYRC
jgi:hypothetical protein